LSIHRLGALCGVTAEPATISLERGLLVENSAMNTAIAAVRRGWRVFANDPPGQRFMSQYVRSQRQRSPVRTAVRIGLGALLTACGMVMWFLPGPGWLLVAFGMAMFASEMRGLARALDRAEVALRAGWRRFRRWWRAASPAR
jgi:hypothetical protein